MVTPTMSADVPQRFHTLPDPPKCSFKDHYVKSNLQKWDLTNSTQIKRFRYEKRHHKLAAKEFLLDFFNDETVQETLQVAGEEGGWTSSKSITDVTCEVVPCDLVSLEFFDRLGEAEPPIVREGNGLLVKCFDNYVEGFPVQDMLREMLLSEESENSELFSKEDKHQLLYRLLEHLVLGGPMCQFEEELEPYLETLKRIYKGLLSVRKNAATGKVEVTSVVYKVMAVEGLDDWQLFPAHSRQNFCYVIVDVMRRQCTVWYHAQTSFW